MTSDPPAPSRSADWSASGGGSGGGGGSEGGRLLERRVLSAADCGPTGRLASGTSRPTCRAAGVLGGDSEQELPLGLSDPLGSCTRVWSGLALRISEVDVEEHGQRSAVPTAPPPINIDPAPPVVLSAH